jgi:hypothetical protein
VSRNVPGNPHASRIALAALATCLVGLSAGCISGRVLTGYPGYPFARFETSMTADSTFFLLQPAVESEGFPLDYTIRDEGFITTRSTEMVGRPVFLTLVVGTNDEASSAKNASDGALADRSVGHSRVWVAAYEETVTGAQRINPLQEEVWSAVMEVTGRLSAAVGGTIPEGSSE